MEYPKKLIEVALPLEDINVAAAREKSIRHGHPSTLHLWWARRPLAAARAVLFAQLVNDPGGKRGYPQAERGDELLVSAPAPQEVRIGLDLAAEIGRRGQRKFDTAGGGVASAIR